MVQFIDQPEPVVALVGAVVPDEANDDLPNVQTLVADGQVRTYPPEFRDLLVYLTTPRPESELVAYLRENGAPKSAIDDLIENEHVIRTPNTSAVEALAAFKGVRAVPMGVVIDVPGTAEGMVFIGQEVGAKNGVPVTAVLANSLFDPDAKADLPAAALRHGRGVGAEGEGLARAALGGLGWLLEKGLARLEWAEDRRE